MQFANQLLRGTLIKRYKRFLADIELETGEIITAHCANSGALYGVTSPGLTVWVSESHNPTRKLKYTWELVKVDEIMVGVNTSWPNGLAAEALQNQLITPLNGYSELKREVKYGKNSRLDILLQDSIKGDCFVEVKNVHMKRREKCAEFPDAVTARGTKHLLEMIDVIETGKRAVMLYIIQRADCDHLRFADDIDPVYARTAALAKMKGVEFYAYDCLITPQEITINTAIPVLF
jgi:sugar fermentation stimulation protein A